VHCEASGIFYIENKLWGDRRSIEVAQNDLNRLGHNGVRTHLSPIQGRGSHLYELSILNFDVSERRGDASFQIENDPCGPYLDSA
jgi:hypothetical protein